MKILLFDIDGTLVNTQGAGRAALDAALASEFGVHAPHNVQISGRTDRGIVRSLFDHFGIEDSEESWRRMRDAYLSHLPRTLAERGGRVLPGVEELLAGVRERNGFALGLLTGNTYEGARLKLEHFGLFQHFAFGGFGDSHFDRNDAAREALESARRHLNADIGGEQVWVLGDTPLDVRCARSIGAKVIAVATGWNTREELVRSEPDVLLDDLADTAAVLRHL